MQHAADTGTEAASALVQDLRFLAVTDQVTFSPYRGLAAFGPGDAQFFFGRDDETLDRGRTDGRAPGEAGTADRVRCVGEWASRPCCRRGFW